MVMHRSQYIQLPRYYNSLNSILNLIANQQILHTYIIHYTLYIIEMIEVRRWRYLGHSLRRKDSIPNTSLSWAPEGSRRRGRPKETWRRTALKQLQGFNIKSWAEAGEIAKYRDRWRDYEKMILTQYSTRNSTP